MMPADPWLLTGALCLLAVNWTVAVTLLRLAYRPPRIRALTERAWLAVLIAVVTTLSMTALLTASDPIRVASRALMVGISLYPVWWLWSYYANRF